MSSSYSSLDWVLSHWAHFAVCRFICVYVCVFCVFSCFILHSCCIIVSTVEWIWWAWSLILRSYLHSVLWYSWLGHLTCKNLFLIWPIMCLVGCQTLLSFNCSLQLCFCRLFGELKGGVTVPYSRREQNKIFAAVYNNLHYDSKEVSVYVGFSRGLRVLALD